MNDKKIYKSLTPNPDKITPTPYSINETQLKFSGVDCPKQPIKWQERMKTEQRQNVASISWGWIDNNFCFLAKAFPLTPRQIDSYKVLKCD